MKRRAGVACRPPSMSMQDVARGLIHEIDALTSAPWYRREPFLVFFPLGILLAWAGVGHWLLFAVGASARFDPIFHAMTQVQGFLMAFAVGFLFTMIPRRTGSRPPATWEVVVCAVAPVATTVAAWWQAWAWAQAAWLVLAVVLVRFAVQRFAGATSRRRPPAGFVWIPLSLLMGVGGSIATAIGTIPQLDAFWLHEVGRGLVLQGMFVGLVLGVGTLAFPLMTRGQAPADMTGSLADRVSMLAHAFAAALVCASFFVESWGAPRLGFGLRTVVTWSVLMGIELWRVPDQPGWNRRLLWVAGWMLPLGYGIATLWPAQRSIGLHVVFIGGFALLALAVATQVTLGHRGYREVMLGRPWPVVAIAVAMAAAIVARSLMQLDPARYTLWMGCAAGSFLTATLFWIVFLAPKFARPAGG